MTTATAKTGAQPLTVDDLLRLHSEGVHGELIRGVLHRTAASGIEHGAIAMKFGGIIGKFV